MSKNEKETPVDQAEVSAKPKKSKKKLGIIAGVAAAVIVVAGAGFWVWHETPGFCDAICHTPMDEYLATYEQSPNSEGVDRYGNAVANTNGMMSVTHAAAGLGCLDCHEPTLSQQIGESVAWITGGYEYPLDQHTLSDLQAASGEEADAFCMNEACHTNADGSVMTREDLCALTADLERNPHEMPHGQVECSTCHKAHTASTNYCTQCHLAADLPAGWISVSEFNKIMQAA